MNIVALDLADDVVLEQVWRIQETSRDVDRVLPVHQTLDEFTKNVRYDYPGERKESAVALLDGRVVGWAEVYLPQRDNLDKSWVEVTVDPEHRQRGAGSLLADWAEGVAREAGRAMVLPQIFVPVDRREDHPRLRFAQNRGYTLSYTEVIRRLDLPVDPATLDRFEAQARAVMGEAYEVSVHHHGVPPELRQSVCDASNRLGADAPTGDIDYEPETMTVEDYQDFLAHEESIGRHRITAVAVHRGSGVVAAYTDLALPAGEPEQVFQWGTLVLPEHRGHRLGMAVKVANLREVARFDPARRLVRTGNAETNPWMVQINVDLGFEIIEYNLALKKVL